MNATATVPRWQTRRLRDAVTKLVDGSHNPPPKQDCGRPMLSARNVDHGQIHFDEYRLISDESFETEDARTRVTPGDVLLTIVGTIGRSAVVLEGASPFALQRSVAVLSPKEDLLPKFLSYQLQSPRLQHHFELHARGTAQKGVYLKTLGETPVLVPPIDEQRKIVAEIEKHFSRLDEAVANLKRVKANLKRYKAAVLKAAVEGRLVPTAAPRSGQGITGSGWKQAEVGEVAQVISGLTKNRTRLKYPRKLPYLRVANVYANELRLDKIEYIGVADNEIDKLLLRLGDMLVVEGNGSIDQIGRVALWDGAIPNCVHQNHLIKVRFGAEVLPEWALLWLLSPGGRHEIEQVSSSTSGLHTLSTGKVRRLPLPLPPISEQEQIVEEVDRRLSLILDAEAAVDANLQRARSLQNATLTRAFVPEVGELSV